MVSMTGFNGSPAAINERLCLFCSYLNETKRIQETDQKHAPTPGPPSKDCVNPSPSLQRSPPPSQPPLSPHSLSLFLPVADPLHFCRLPFHTFTFLRALSANTVGIWLGALISLVITSTAPVLSWYWCSRGTCPPVHLTGKRSLPHQSLQRFIYTIYGPSLLTYVT